MDRIFRSITWEPELMYWDLAYSYEKSEENVVPDYSSALYDLWSYLYVSL